MDQDLEDEEFCFRTTNGKIIFEKFKPNTSIHEAKEFLANKYKFVNNQTLKVLPIIQTLPQDADDHQLLSEFPEKRFLLKACFNQYSLKLFSDSRNKNERKSILVKEAEFMVTPLPHGEPADEVARLIFFRKEYKNFEKDFPDIKIIDEVVKIAQKIDENDFKILSFDETKKKINSLLK